MIASFFTELLATCYGGSSPSSSSDENYERDYGDSAADEYDDVEDDFPDFCFGDSAQIVETTLRRDFLLVKLQDLVDAKTARDAEIALIAMGNEAIDDEKLLKFLLRAGGLRFIRDSIAKTYRRGPTGDDDDEHSNECGGENIVGPYPSNVDAAPNAAVNATAVAPDDSNDEGGEEIVAAAAENTDTACIPDAASFSPSSKSSCSTDCDVSSIGNDSPMQNIIATAGGNSSGMIDPSIAAPLLQKLIYYDQQRTKRKRRTNGRGGSGYLKSRCLALESWIYK